MPPTLVILTTSHKQELSHEEVSSIKQCENILSKYDKYFVLPVSLNTEYYENNFPSYRIISVPDSWMKDWFAFGQMKIKPYLYKKISSYDYVLFYEPDAYIFRDDLDYWMKKDYDYIGAPWFEEFYSANDTSKFVGVGNGGFSLRKVKSLLKVSSSLRPVLTPRKLYKIIFENQEKDLKKHFIFLKWLLLGNLHHPSFNHYRYEDIYWGLYVPQSIPWFKVAPFEDAYRFSFEARPEYLYQLNDNKLPTGCHAWFRHGYLNFWEHHIEY